MSAARTAYETLLVERDRGVALLTLNRPDRLNAFKTTLELALDIATNTSPTAVALTKRLFYRYLEQGDRMAARKEELDAFRWLAGQPDARESVAAFREKRLPDWPVTAEELPW
jgi:enoyl-CoA hydratase/carnithine racemase